MKNARILIVEPEGTTRVRLARLLRGRGYSIETAHDGFKALACESVFAPEVVLTEVRMPGMDGFELLDRLRARGSQAAIVLMSGCGGMSTAVRALRQGAVDCLSKPIDEEELIASIERALDEARVKRDSSQLRTQLQQPSSFEGMIGSSPAMQRVFSAVAQVAPSRASVLITGQSGTGKELVAAAIHRRSQRATRPFVKLHCAALAPTLLESELFGHERGAYTGADRRRLGRFESAEGGTLFLDEIGEIALPVQTKLLRVLQEHAFERVGGNETLHVDVRVIAATNRDLVAMVGAGQFREDLFYRLNVIGIETPALRDRMSDIPALVAHALQKFASESGKPTCGISDRALASLSRYEWPGNVRELENAIEHALVFADGTRIEPEHLPAQLRTQSATAQPPCVPGATLDEIERHAILTTLEATAGSTSKTAEILGVSVRMVQYRVQRYSAAPQGGTRPMNNVDSGNSERLPEPRPRAMTSGPEGALLRLRIDCEGQPRTA